jgi:hypothetical protein
MNKYNKAVRRMLENDPQVVRSLKIFSGSDAEYNQRISAHADSISATLELEDMALKDGASSKYRKAFAAGPGITEANLQGTTIVDAIIRASVSSIAPIFAKEVSVNQPELLLQFIDAHNLMDQNVSVPNLGADTGLGDDMLNIDSSAIFDGNETDFTIATSVRLVPGTLEIKYIVGNDTTIIKDDAQGNLVTKGGVLAAGSKVTYSSGSIAINFATAPARTSKLIIKAVSDEAGEDELDSLVGNVKNFRATTSPMIIPVVRNIMGEHLIARQGVLNTKDYYANLVETTYTRKINTRIVKCLTDNYIGDTYTADLSAFDIGTSGYGTFVRTFKSILTDANQYLAQQCYTGASATGYLAGKKAANLFMYMNPNEGFIRNTEMGYYKDVIGWFDEVPVVRWEGDGLADDEVMLTHKTPGGELAPVVRPIFLTPTDIAEVFSFNNPMKVKSGLFAVDGANPTSSKLSVKVKFDLPEGQYLAKV